MKRTTKIEEQDFDDEDLIDLSMDNLEMSMNNSKNQLEEALSQGNSMSEDENEKSLIHILDSEDWLQRSEDHFNSTSWVGSNS